MTPAINTLKKAKISFKVHQYQHQTSVASYGEEAAIKLGLETKQVFKTLVVTSGNNQLAVAIVPVAGTLDLKKAAVSLGVKKVSMADAAVVERSTGYVLGGVSPVGQKKALPTIIDNSAQNFDCVFVSAGRRGLEIELSPSDLRLVTGASFGDIASD